MELDFVYRSANSDMSSATDVAFLTPIVMATAFSNGAIDIVNIDERTLLSSHKFSQAVTGLAVCSDSLLIVQLKSHSVSCWTLIDWKCRWSKECPTATTFSKPVFASKEVYYVSSGLSQISCASIDSGAVLHVVDRPNNVSGMVVAMTTAADHAIFALFESNHILQISQGSIHRVIHLGVVSEMSIPTAISLHKNGSSWIVGHADGKLMEINFQNDLMQTVLLIHPTGIGAILGSQELVGSWSGELFTILSNNIIPIGAPHAGSAIRQISASTEYIAVASSDGRISTYFTNLNDRQRFGGQSVLCERSFS